jgi:hypothetical protein
LCDADEESSSDMLSEELTIDYDDEFNLEIEVRARAKHVLLHVGG